jgi:hypothetical protein
MSWQEREHGKGQFIGFAIPESEIGELVPWQCGDPGKPRVKHHLF